MLHELNVFSCSNEGGVEQCDSCELRPAPFLRVRSLAPLFFFSVFHSYSASGRQDGSLPPNLKRQ